MINFEPGLTGGYAVQAANNSAVCFGFCTRQGNDPSFLKASVASSGFGKYQSSWTAPASLPSGHLHGRHRHFSTFLGTLYNWNSNAAILITPR